jgi:hypothetical protein
MNHHFTIRSGHLEVEVSQCEGEADVNRLFESIQDAASQSGQTRLLLRIRDSDLGSVTAQYRFIESVLAPRFRWPYKIAKLFDSDLAHRNALFFENVAVNRGVSLRVFRDRTQALDWLREGSG